MKKIACLATALLAVAVSFASHAQAPWPSKTVRIISPFPPGGSVDQVARILAAQLSTQTGQQFIVENRTGASGAIGTQAVSTAPADGYTWGVVFDTHAVNPALMPTIPYDTLKDLSSVMLIGTSPMAIVAHKDQPFRDFRDVLAAAKSSPVAVGSIGTGSLGHLAIAQIASTRQVQFNHIPYKGGGPLMIDAVGGQVPLAIGTVFLAMPHVKGGKVRALAVTSPKRSPQLPDVGTVAEQGVPGFSALAWWGFIGPAHVPAAVLKQMYDQLTVAVRNPGVVEKLSQQGMDISGGGPEEMDRFLRSEMARWAEVVKENRIRAGD
jgi:tripartite-type tricarboxylate transporter receptor subunit TctC